MVQADPTTRTDRRRARTRASLIAAAREVFASQGVEASTIQDITEAADVAKGSFYNHFDSRRSILRAVVDETLGELGRAMDLLTEPMRDDPARVLSVCIRHTLRACVEDPILGWFSLRAGVVMAIGDATLGAYGRRDIRRGIESGRFQCDDLEVALTMLGGGIEALLRRRLLGDLPREADIIFAADSLRLLGVSREEAAAIAAEDLAEIGQFEIVQR
ncbi:MAG: helix-turn-helix transcriptional regulator [Deltaproteobacteria bacterium]|nr:helix-turn-helix transcriptional regulator [Deltaproteobacteria bacterium]